MIRKQCPSFRTAAVLAAAMLLSAVPLPAQNLKDPGVLQALREGKTKLKRAMNAWNLELFLGARDAFLKACVLNRVDHADLLYYIVLADYRLASFHMTTGQSAEVDRFAREGQQYGVKVLALGPKSGEIDALQGLLMGLELTVHPEEAMTLGLKSFQYLARADQKDPENPRVNLLQSVYMLYVPAEYGGGPDSARPYLEKAVALFEKETVTDPVKPDWGRDEAFLSMGLLYKQTKDEAKAAEMFKKVLAVNPGSGRAKAELAALGK